MNHWNLIREALRPTMSEESYTNWLEPVRQSPGDDGLRLRLQAPNEEAREWLESELQFDILASARALGMSYRSLAVDTVAPSQRLVQQGLFPAEPPRVNERYSFDRFVVGPCNEFAHAAAQAVAERPAERYNPLYLHSPVGMGKTHLLHAIARRVGREQPSLRVVYVSAEEFMNEMIKSIRHSTMRGFHERYRRADALLVDDIQVIGSKERTQEEFFHTFNALHNRGKQIVLSSDASPESIPGLVGRLRSRFAWGLMADIQPAALETRMAILDRKAEESGVLLPEDARDLVARRLCTSIRELEGFLNRLIARAQFLGGSITPRLARTLLEAQPRAAAQVGLDEIRAAVAAAYGVSAAELGARSNVRKVALPRQVAMYLSRKHARATYADIGRAFGKHHTTVMHSVQKIERYIESDSALKAKIEDLEETINQSDEFRAA